MTAQELKAIQELLLAARVVWVRLGDCTDAQVNRLGTAIKAVQEIVKDS